jgi:hypothetical protein
MRLKIIRSSGAYRLIRSGVYVHLSSPGWRLMSTRPTSQLMRSIRLIPPRTSKWLNKRLDNPVRKCLRWACHSLVTHSNVLKITSDDEGASVKHSWFQLDAPLAGLLLRMLCLHSVFVTPSGRSKRLTSSKRFWKVESSLTRSFSNYPWHRFDLVTNTHCARGLKLQTWFYWH